MTDYVKQRGSDKPGVSNAYPKSEPLSYRTGVPSGKSIDYRDSCPDVCPELTYNIERTVSMRVVSDFNCA